MRLDADWVRAPAAQAVMRALGEGYFVGGCVRNELLGAPVADIDIATPIEPETAVQRLEATDLRVIPTGLKHGTVTAVHNGTAIEVTTFRTDVETDGRHATVRYTTDMAEDAARRDFTMNALYANAEGTVIDPLGGLVDLNARHVRFIGRPEDRIREDYLRILRFFRFHALYGRDLDVEGLAACAEHAAGIEGLARERIGWEFRKLLAARDPAPSVASMEATGILARCLPGSSSATLAPLVHVESLANVSPHWATRLAALGGTDPVTALRLSRAEAALLERTRAALADQAPTAQQAFRFGPEAALAASLIRAASLGSTALPDLSEDIARGAAQSFPISAADLLAAGIPQGPTLGATLRALEAAWVESDFTLDKATLIAKGRADASA